MFRTRVAVLGGGIIGLGSAVAAIETVPGLDVTLLSADFTPNTTADGAAGLWYPYLLGDVPEEKIRFWCKETFDFLLDLSTSPKASECGVSLLSAYFLSPEPLERPSFADILLEFRPLAERELQMFPKEYKHGLFVTSLYAECAKLLPVLMDRFRACGGRIIKRRVNDIKELAGIYDVVINCTGVHAAQLVPDPDVHPIRGQVLRVQAPWIKHAVVGQPNFHIIPNSDTVVCGGTKQRGSWSTVVDQEDSQRIWEGCCKLVPSLKNAKIVKQWVGLRPGRSKPRVECDTLVTADGTKLEVIHNYGHGGSGITLFWGCAKDCTKLLRQVVDNIRQVPAKL